MSNGVVPLVRWTWCFVRPYRRRVASIFVLSLVEIALVSLAPWPLKVVVDNVLGAQPLPPRVAAFLDPLTGSSPVVLLLLVVVAGLLIQLTGELVKMVHTQVQVETGQRMVYSLRAALLSHMQALALGHHVSGSIADSAYRMESDAYCIHDLVMDGVFPLVTAVLTLGVMFAVLLRLDATLALLSLVVIPFLYAALGYYSRCMVDRAEGVKELESKLLERVFEVLGSIKVVKSFARERHELDRFSRAGDDTMRARLRLTWQESAFSVVVTAITLGGTALVLAVGGLHVLRGELTVGSLLVVIAYLAAVYNPLSSIAHTTGSLQNALASARRVRSVLELPREGLERADAVDAVNLRGDVRFEEVGFAYDKDRPILEGISFAARPGEMVALVGLTGAGKTTVASLIPRFYEPTRGRITIDGVDVARYRIGSLREQVALVLQEPMLFSGTIADNIRYGRLDATETEVEQAARAAHAHAFIARLPKGYQTTVAEAGGSLSGGERQRLSIARALLKNAPILVLDEPTSSLDALSEEAVFEALRRLRAGRTTIVIAHRLSTIRDADRILVLHDGRIAAEGTHDELLAGNELYRRMCARLSVGRSLDEPETVDELIQALG